MHGSFASLFDIVEVLARLMPAIATRSPSSDTCGCLRFFIALEGDAPDKDDDVEEEEEEDVAGAATGDGGLAVSRSRIAC